MSFSTVCSNCDARLTAPDTVEGKRVKCKKCGEAFLAKRAAEDDDEDERPAKPIKSTVKMPAVKAKSKPARDDEDSPRKSTKAARRPADDDEDDDEEPKPKAKKKGKGKSKKQAGSPVLLYVLIGVGALLVLGGGSVGAYYGFIKEDSKADSKGGGTNGPTGAGKDPPRMGGFAEEMTSPDGTFSARFASAPKQETKNVQTPQGPISAQVLTSEAADGTYIIVSTNLPAGEKLDPMATDAALEMAANAMLGQVPGGKIESNTKITHKNEHPAREVVISKPDGSRAIARVIVSPGKVFNLIVIPKPGLKLDEARARQFFDLLSIR